MRCFHAGKIGARGARAALPASLLGTASHVNAGCRRGGQGMGTAQGDSVRGEGP